MILRMLMGAKTRSGRASVGISISPDAWATDSVAEPYHQAMLPFPDGQGDPVPR
jgi:hypothetical protein